MTEAVRVPARPRPDSPRRVVLALAALEARRILTHPAPAAGLLLSVFFARQVLTAAPSWAGAAYMSLPVVVGPLLCGISLAAAAAFSRDRRALSEEAPVRPGQRALARLLAGVPAVAAVAVLTGAGALWLRAAGGLDLGDEPGRTLHAHYTLPELLQPVPLAAFAVAFGAAAARLIRHRLAAAVAVFVVWFAVSPTSWMWNGPGLMAFSLIQTQPLVVPVGPATADAAGLPASWLLSAPNEYQDFWGRVVVSPAMAAWHDVYLVGLTLLAASVVLDGRARRTAGAAGLVLAVAGVTAQKLVQP
ncbi:MAG: hypothetical protein ACLGIV_14565 [Actinomycetes bacterium]